MPGPKVPKMPRALGYRLDSAMAERSPGARREGGPGPATGAAPGVGVGDANEEADELAQQVVVAEVLEYADAVRASTGRWLRALSEDEVEATNR